MQWWEKPDQESRHRDDGTYVPEAGPCPRCGGEIVYNGNYFCGSYGRGCNWALAHPATKVKDKAVCDALGIGYF